MAELSSRVGIWEGNMAARGDATRDGVITNPEARIGTSIAPKTRDTTSPAQDARDGATTRSK